MSFSDSAGTDTVELGVVEHEPEQRLRRLPVQRRRAAVHAVGDAVQDQLVAAAQPVEGLLGLTPSGHIANVADDGGDRRIGEPVEDRTVGDAEVGGGRGEQRGVRIGTGGLAFAHGACFVGAAVPQESAGYSYPGNTHVIMEGATLNGRATIVYR